MSEQRKAEVSWYQGVSEHQEGVWKTTWQNSSQVMGQRTTGSPHGTWQQQHQAEVPGQNHDCSTAVCQGGT